MKLKYKILLLCIFLFSAASMIGQEADVYMTFNTWKYTDDTRALITNLITDGEEDEIPAVGLSVNYYMVSEEDEILLGNAKTDENGVASFPVPESTEFVKDEEFYIYFISRFDGDDTYIGTEEELAVKDVKIDFTFEIIDSVKTILYNGIIYGIDGEEMPLPDDDLYFFVPRMFSDLKFADGWFEEDGTGVLEFPTDIIGDTLGNITVIARLEEHYDYGFVERKYEIDWAVPSHAAHVEGPDRTLWTPIAPAWMIITLIIMLAGVWGHYMYAVYQLYMIKKSSKKTS